MTNPASGWTTPNPSVKVPPPSPSRPFTSDEITAIGTALMDGFLAQVLLAVANISIFGQKPFAGLQQWATELQNDANNALSTAEGAQGTANTANTNATTALGNWASLFTSLGLPSQTVTALATWLTSAQAAANNALSYWETTFSNLATTTANDFTAFIQSIQSAANTAGTNASSALSQLASMISAVGGTAISDVNTFITNTWAQVTNTWNGIVSAITGTTSTGNTASTVQTATATLTSNANTALSNAASALSQWASALSSAGQSTAANLGTFVSNTWAQLGNTWNGLVSAFTGTTSTGQTASTTQSAATSVASTANTANTNASSGLSQIAAMLSAAGQSTATAIGSFISTLGSNIQSTWNNLVSAFTGTSATGQTASNVQTAATAITSTANTASTNASSALSSLASLISNAGQSTIAAVGGFISTLGTNLQSTWDNLVSAFTGSSSTGNTTSTLKTAAASTTSTANTASTNASSALSSLASFISNAGQSTIAAAGSFLSTLGTNLQSTLNGLVSAFTGASATGQTPSQVQTAAASATSVANTASTNASTAITNNNNLLTALFGSSSIGSFLQSALLPGIAGVSDLGASVQAGFDAIVQGLKSTTATNNGLAAVSNAASSTAAIASGASTIAQQTSLVQAQQAISKPSTPDATMDWSINPWTGIPGGTPSYLSMTQATNIMGFIRTAENTPKLSVAWWGQLASGSMTAFYINVWSINATTGVLTKVYASPNIVLGVGTAFQQNYYDLSSAITVAPGDGYYVELSMIGTGTYQVVGLPGHWTSSGLPPSTVYPQQLGATRPNPVARLDAYGTAAAGSATSGAIPITIGSGATALYAVLNLPTNTAGTPTVTCKLGTTAMTQIEAFQYDTPSGQQAWIYVFALYGSPLAAGAQNVNWTSSIAAYASGIVQSFFNITSHGTPVAASGSTNPISQSATSAVGNLLLNAMVNPSVSGTINTQNQTVIGSVGGVSGQHTCTATQYAPASGVSQTFSAQETTVGAWGSVIIPLIGGVPTVPTSLSTTQYASSPNIPVVGLGDTSATVTPIYTPVLTEYSTPGTYTYNIPAWVSATAGNCIDVVMIAGGASGGIYNGAAGSSFFVQTLVCGTDFPVGATSITVVVGAAGTGGFQQGGGNSSVTYPKPGGGTTTLSATSNANSSGSVNGGAAVGNSGSAEIFNGNTYYGGGAAAAYIAGQPPGGGAGGSGSANIYETGSPGAVWLLAYQ